MALECPNGHGRQNVVQNITPNFAPTARAADVVAKKLACGCVVGGEEYNAFLANVHQINAEEAVAIAAIKKGASDRRATTYKGLVAANKGA
jgi:hypothetical protein